MTLASHVRIPPFFFFAEKNIEQQNQKSREKYSFYPYTMLICHTVCYWFKRLWSWYKPVLCNYHASIECGSIAYKFFQNWLRVLTLASVRSTLTLFRRRCYGFWTFYANKEKIKTTTTTTKTCLKMWLVKKIVGFVMAPKHLTAPGDSARPGPRSWSASKPSAWPMDVAQTIQLISFVTM